VSYHWRQDELNKLIELLECGNELTARDYRLFPDRSQYAVNRKAKIIRRTLNMPRPARKICGLRAVDFASINWEDRHIARQSHALHSKTIEVALKNNSECFGLSKAQVRAKAVELGLLEAF